MTDAERQLLQKLASAGKATTLSLDELLVAELLEAQGLALIVPKTSDAIITPKGRNRLGTMGPRIRQTKKPGSFFE